MSEPRHHWPNRLEIDASVYLAPGAIVTGEVAIGARSSVWFHTVLRGDTERIVVGDDTNLQDLTLVHVDPGLPALIGHRVTVGHRAIVHGCVIGDDCLIGMGAIVLSGARIGAGSLIGAGALVREGQEIPPGSLAVGSPARVVGPVAEPHRAAIERGTRHYVALSREYLARGFGQAIPATDDPRGVLGPPQAEMTFEEWSLLLSVLEETPAWVEARRTATVEPVWIAAPSAGRWSAQEIVSHLRASDLQVFSPRLQRLLSEDQPSLEAAHGNQVAWQGSPAELVAAWREERRDLVSRLATLGPADWCRSGHHSRIGPYSIAAMARAWGEHDLSHRRQIERALAGRP